MARRLRRDHDHVVALRRLDPAEVDVQPVREKHRGAGLEVRRDIRVPDLLLHVVGDEHRDELRAAHGLGDRADLEACILGRLRASRFLRADRRDVDAGVAEVERVRVALAAEADDGDLAVEKLELAVAMNRCHVGSFQTRDVLRDASRRACGAAESDAAGSAELLQAVRTDELLERVDLLRRADELEDDRVGTEVGDACAEHVGERHQLGALRSEARRP